MVARSEVSRGIRSVAEANPFDTAGLCLYVVDPKAHDVTCLVLLQSLAEIGRRPDGLALQRENDVGSTGSATSP